MSRAATDPPVAAPRPADNVGVIGFDLIVLQGDGDSTHQPLTDGMVISTGRTYNVAARTTGDNIGAVKFALNDESNFRREGVAPYAMCGDSGGNYFECHVLNSAGTYTVTATAVSDDNDTINRRSVTFVVE